MAVGCAPFAAPGRRRRITHCLDTLALLTSLWPTANVDILLDLLDIVS
ncbi:MAG: hypothetical protein M3069_14040 [Chloroflexota bacterium]|nr:hypothetical protein [Chloroflexota bacterium]